MREGWNGPGVNTKFGATTVDESGVRYFTSPPPAAIPDIAKILAPQEETNLTPEPFISVSGEAQYIPIPVEYINGEALNPIVFAIDNDEIAENLWLSGDAIRYYAQTHYPEVPLEQLEVLYLAKPEDADTLTNEEVTEILSRNTSHGKSRIVIWTETEQVNSLRAKMADHTIDTPENKQIYGFCTVDETLLKQKRLDEAIKLAAHYSETTHQVDQTPLLAFGNEDEALIFYQVTTPISNETLAAEISAAYHSCFDSEHITTKSIQRQGFSAVELNSLLQDPKVNIYISRLPNGEISYVHFTATELTDEICQSYTTVSPELEINGIPVSDQKIWYTLSWGIPPEHRISLRYNVLRYYKQFIPYVALQVAQAPIIGGDVAVTVGNESLLELMFRCSKDHYQQPVSYCLALIGQKEE